MIIDGCIVISSNFQIKPTYSIRLLNKDSIPSVGFRETFRCLVQAEGKARLVAARQQAHRGAGDNPSASVSSAALPSLELDARRRFLSFGGADLRQSAAVDARALREARRRGRLHEEMLDARERAKSDRFCK